MRSGIKMAYEINRFQTFLGHGERRNADIVLGSDRWNDRIEIRGFRIRFKAEHLRQSLGDIDIEADRGLAVLGQELGRGIGSIGADGQRASPATESGSSAAISSSFWMLLVSKP